MTQPSISPTAAIALRRMLATPKKPQYSDGLAKEIGVSRPTMREILNRLETAGWLASTKETAATNVPARRWFTLTGWGIKAARDELKTWEFTD